MSRLCPLCGKPRLPQVPHFQALVQRSRHEGISIGRERNAVYGILVPAQPFHLLARPGIPHADNGIKTSRGDEFRIGRD